MHQTHEFGFKQLRKNYYFCDIKGATTKPKRLRFKLSYTPKNTGINHYFSNFFNTKILTVLQLKYRKKIIFACLALAFKHKFMRLIHETLSKLAQT